MLFVHMLGIVTKKFKNEKSLVKKFVEANLRNTPNQVAERPKTISKFLTDIYLDLYFGVSNKRLSKLSCAYLQFWTKYLKTLP